MNYTFKYSGNNSTNFNLIRGVAAQLIAFTHAREAFITLEIKNTLGAASLGLLFLISGILISYSTFRRMNNEKFEFKRFFIRRFSRIYPPLIIILILVLLIDGYLIFIVYEAEPNEVYSISSFLISLILLNDSAISITGFSSIRPLWALPLFWYLFLFFGWLILGWRTFQKKSLYWIVLGIISYLLIIVCLGFHSVVKIGYVIIWFTGVLFSYLINKMNLIVNKKIEKEEKKDLAEKKLKRKIKYNNF
jgi:peptidoglycan/LPS O-acetylase OafA/YrhL